MLKRLQPNPSFNIYVVGVVQIDYFNIEPVCIRANDMVFPEFFSNIAVECSFLFA